MTDQPTDPRDETQPHDRGGWPPARPDPWRPAEPDPWRPAPTPGPVVPSQADTQAASFSPAPEPRTD
ncbi:MAG: hypothetical protein M3Q66_06930, partial [Chloroflexota bacterium]|nr:hypothetical protein [Chloroflexota bacterium]